MNIFKTPVLAFGRSLALGLFALGAASTAVPALAAQVMQTPGAEWPTDQDDATDWLMNMPAPVFLKFALAIVDKKTVVGTDYDYIVNPSRHALISVTCHYKRNGKHWDIVGDKPYDNGDHNPHEIQPRSVAKVSLKDFNQYCDFFTAVADNGDSYMGGLNIQGDSVKSFAIVINPTPTTLTGQ